MPSPVTLPTATIQDDFTTVLSEVHAGLIPSENIWLSFYKEGEPSVHGKVTITLHEQDRDRVELNGTGGVELRRTSQLRYTARCLGLGIDSVDFISPTEIYADPSHSDERHPRQITAFAISNELLVTTLLDGTLSVYNLPPPSDSASSSYPVPSTHTIQPVVASKLHKSVINALEISSGTSSHPLLASAGSDFCINLTPLPTTLGIPPLLTPFLSLRHTRPVSALLPLLTDSLLSASTDGWLHMWDIRTGTPTAKWMALKPPVALAASTEDADGTVWVAFADGNVHLLDRRTGTLAEKWAAGASARAIAASADGRDIALGAVDGMVALYDVRGGSTRERWKRGGAQIESISFAPGSRVVVGSEDGLPYVVDFMKEGNRAGLHINELVFGNVEAVRALRVSGGFAYITGDGGVVRKYQL
ncbi:WD40-repeat-containing domain protein [Multifurca ochricompacta]|uniref:WD40-repeat-containing domain protein n=1 Tax=Multifurca ochricompacta TaxID=376703 RepID=A0AAD4QM11_9AGAM|nr:WD40-repeat-containing domain protein [Multifurca ochricompacta]